MFQEDYPSLVHRAATALEAAYLTLQRNECCEMWSSLMTYVFVYFCPTPLRKDTSLNTNTSMIGTLSQRANIQKSEQKPLQTPILGASRGSSPHSITASSPSQSQQRIFSLLRKCDTLERAIAAQRSHMMKVIGERDEVIRLWRSASAEVANLKEELVRAAEIQVFREAKKEVQIHNISTDNNLAVIKGAHASPIITNSIAHEGGSSASRTVSAALTATSSIVPKIASSWRDVSVPTIGRNDPEKLLTTPSQPVVQTFPTAFVGAASTESQLQAVQVLSPNTSMITPTASLKVNRLGNETQTPSSSSVPCTHSRNTSVVTSKSSIPKTKVVFMGGRAPPLTTRKEQAAIKAHRNNNIMHVDSQSDPLGREHTVTPGVEAVSTITPSNSEGASNKSFMSIGKWETL